MKYNRIVHHGVKINKMIVTNITFSLIFHIRIFKHCFESFFIFVKYSLALVLLINFLFVIK